MPNSYLAILCGGGIVVASAPLMEIHIRVLAYEPGKPGRVVDLPDSVEAIQQLVGGYFEVLVDANVGVHIYVNEEGRSRGLPRNRRFGVHDIVGTAVFTRHDGNGETAGLSDDDVKVITALYG